MKGSMMSEKVNEVERIKQAKDGYDVLADLLRYSDQGDYDAIAADDVNQRFKWFGVYRQKPNTGHFMLRLKIPGGQLSPAQLKGIGELVDQYARGFSDITTRQTIQLHWLTIADVRPVFEALAKLGMNSQFACGDVPRNVVSCPLAGVLADEFIDASQVVRDVARMYHDGAREFSNLPRKFKTSIGGCSTHCHQPQINDVGMYGVRRADGSIGYGLLVGGGLSSTPHYGQPMRAFVKPEQVVDVCRAIAILFREHGYRERRTRARLKFLVADKGWQWTRDTIEHILGYALERDNSLLHPPAMHGDHVGIGRQKDGNCYVGVPIARGRWTARQMADIADLACEYAAGEQRIRLTAKQNVILLDVPPQRVDALVERLTSAGLPPQAHPLRDTLISCTGTEFCNLAIVETKHRAGRILDYLEKHTRLDRPLVISVTGCPNSCAQYQIADIGLMGSLANDPDGKTDEHGKPLKVDAYNVLLGGALGADPQFGQTVAKKVVADRIHLSIENLVNHYLAERVDADEALPTWAGRNDAQRLEQLIVQPTLTR